MRGPGVAACLAMAVLGCGDGSGGSGAPDASTDAPPSEDVVEDFPLSFMESSPPPEDAQPAGPPVATLSAPSLDIGPIPCGTSMMGGDFGLTNNGLAPLTVMGTITGAGFSVTPDHFTLGPGGTAVVTVNVSIPATTAAGAMLATTLTLVTNDPNNAMVTIPVTAVALGATLSFQPGAPTTLAFPETEVGSHATTLPALLVNSGNAPATFTFSPPSDAHFAFAVPDGGAVMLNGGETWIGETDFTPTDTVPLTATTTITPSGAMCGTSVQSITFTGQGATGSLTGWPSTIDFGPADCGGTAPAGKGFQLMNPGNVDVSITQVQLLGTPGFTTNASVANGRVAAGGTLNILVDAPAVPAESPITPITATLMIETDGDTAPHSITLTEEPSGALLGFDTSPTPNFGSFGQISLVQSTGQAFNVKNTGSAPASVTLTTSPDPPFSLGTAMFSVAAGASVSDSVTFSPVVGGGVSGSIALSASGVVCGTPPAPLALAGSGFGGTPSVSPSSLHFYPLCGGGSPGAAPFVVTNNGTGDMTWTLNGPTGAGASFYTVASDPPPGILPPGGESVIVVTPGSIPSPATTTDPQAFSAQITILTDVPFDPPHVVSLSATPIGDQLAFVTPGPVVYGQIPVGESMTNRVVITNQANSASPNANVSFTFQGSGAAAYSAPAALSVPAAGGTAGGNVVFLPTSPDPDPATLALLTNDPLCTPLPTPLVLFGTGTEGKVQVSATTLALGSDPSDPAGLVNCGATGLSQTFTVSNVGNQEFQITGLTLGKGASSPFTLSGVGSALPTTVPIGGGVQITVSPDAIPQDVADPDDPTLFADTLTVTTNAALDAPHVVSLVMQARGAVIANTPLATSWTFGTTTQGSIGTFTSTLRNTGNAAASVSLGGLAQPAIFGLASNPTPVAPNAVTSIVGQFSPPAADGVWTDQGTLTVTTSQAFCEPLPATWTSPTIDFSGASSSSATVTYSGSLAFPTTDCGSAAPAAQDIVLTNNTDQPLPFTATLSSGRYYTLTSPAFGDGGAATGTIPASGTATLVVTPGTITPAQGVQAGGAPYGDDLLVNVDTSSPDGGSSQVTSFAIPVTWALNGAVLSLPDGQGTEVGPGGSFYPADTTGGFTLPMANSGTSSASVTFGISPSGAFAVSPAPPVSVLPNVGASPDLVAASSDAACPNATGATATFFYSGPVCQPFEWPSVSLQVCSGTF